MNNNKTIKIDILENTDRSVSCINALNQVMEYYSLGASSELRLSTNGKDKRAVYQWFVERYNTNCKINIK